MTERGADFFFLLVLVGPGRRRRGAARPCVEREEKPPPAESELCHGSGLSEATAGSEGTARLYRPRLRAPDDLSTRTKYARQRHWGQRSSY